MKSHLLRSAARTLAIFLIQTTLSLSTAQASENVAWSELSQKIERDDARSAMPEDHQYRVRTKDGKTHTGHAFILSPSGVRVDVTGPPILREQVTEITVRRTKSLLHEIFAPAGAVVGGAVCGASDGYCFPSPVMVILVLPVALAITAAAAPITLSIHGIRKLLSGKTYKVAP